MSYSPVCSRKLYCVCWQTYLTLLFKSMCHHFKAVWKGPAPLQFPKKPKLVWVLCLSKETAFWVLPFLQSADFYPVCEMNVDMFPALVLLQSNDRSWVCPPSSLDALSIDLLGNLCFLKEHFKLLFFYYFILKITLPLFSHGFTCLSLALSQACIDCCATCGTSSRVSTQSTIILYGKI